MVNEMYERFKRSKKVEVSKHVIKSNKGASIFTLLCASGALASMRRPKNVNDMTYDRGYRNGINTTILSLLTAGGALFLTDTVRHEMSILGMDDESSNPIINDSSIL